VWPPRTLVVTDRGRLGPCDEVDQDARVVAFVAAMAAAGVDAVQLRERDWPDGRLLRVSRAARTALAGSACRLLVNERAHVAIAAGAHGVHLRSDGMPAVRVRLTWPSALLIGRSMHVGDAPSDAAGADLVMFGTVFPSPTKGAGARVVGVSALAEWSRHVGMPPVVAVGGIDLDRCESVRDAGACGVAGIDLFVRAWQQGAASLASLVTEIHAVFRDGERAE
jgi:thiamine-phosphate pyrophosphorylase